MEIEEQLKKIIIDEFKLIDVKPEEIKNDSFLFGDEGLGLDSLDAVELVVILKRHFEIEIKDMESAREIFQSVGTLAEYIRETKAA